MIEWVKFYKDFPPAVGTTHIAIDISGLITHGHYNYSAGHWLDQNGSEIKWVTHYAEINLPTEGE